MTPKRPNSQFLSGLDQQTLNAINNRIAKLEPLMEEYRELIRRKRAIESRNGNHTTEEILRVLSECPGGLTTGEIASLVDKTIPQARSTLADLVKAGKIERDRPGFFRIIGG